MAVPVHLFLKDDGGAMIRGGSDVQDREGSVELRGLTHNLSIPTDGATGKLTGTRKHAPFLFDKGIDSSSPYLYKAVATGQTLQSAEFKFYHINNAGQEVEYFNMDLTLYIQTLFLSYGYDNFLRIYSRGERYPSALCG